MVIGEEPLYCERSRKHALRGKTWEAKFSDPPPQLFKSEHFSNFLGGSRCQKLCFSLFSAFLLHFSLPRPFSVFFFFSSPHKFPPVFRIWGHPLFSPGHVLVGKNSSPKPRIEPQTFCASSGRATNCTTSFSEHGWRSDQRSLRWRHGGQISGHSVQDLLAWIDGKRRILPFGGTFVLAWRRVRWGEVFIEGCDPPPRHRETWRSKNSWFDFQPWHC